MIVIDLYGDPVPQKRPRFRRTEKYVQTYDPQSQEKEQYRWQLRSQFRNKPLTVPLEMDVIFYMPIPKATSFVRKKLMIANTMHHMKRPDIDNLMKYILDCMNGIVFQDDAQIWSIRAQKIYAESPGTLIKINPSTYENHEKSTSQTETTSPEDFRAGNISREYRSATARTNASRTDSKKDKRTPFRLEEGKECH